jgi:RES domain-containing protein
VSLRYRGPLFRSLNPRWAQDPLSGEGARRFGGRFNRQGRPALYTSLSILTAVREANQVGTLQPTVLVSYRADLFPVFDAADPRALEEQDLNPEILEARDWRIAMRNGPAPTQALAERLIEEGYCGMRVPSFAPGAGPKDLNLVLWRWKGMLTLVDDEGRLG